ncbi:MAG: molybdate ABC transporter permease subunit [Chloroflexi bacterium]|nr:molybdate ABC transporter permease subunit [Chloroflexota bacterium]
MEVFLLPGIVLALFVAVPLGALVYRALQTGNILDSLRKPIVHEALKLSLMTSALTLMIVVALGTPLAYVLARSRFPGKRILDTLIDLPIVLPPVVAGVALLMAFGRRGVFGGDLRALGVELAFTTKAVILAQVFVSAPFYIRSAKAGFQSVDVALEQMAYTLGVSRVRTFFRVTLPLALPAVFGGAVLCWARALSEFGATMMFAGNYRGTTQTMPLAILTALESDLFAALSISVILLAVSFAVLLVFRVLSREGIQG